MDKESGINIFGTVISVLILVMPLAGPLLHMYDLSGVYTNGTVVIYPQQNTTGNRSITITISAHNKMVIINKIFVTNSSPVWLIVSAIGEAL